MSKELEAFTGGMLGGFWSRFRSDGKSAHEPPPPGTKCLNCETVLEGRFCHACGQEHADHHRSILHLTWETIESMFHVDGRLWRTIPWLFFKPGELSKEYFEGKRARHVPPFRTFLVTLLIFILAAEAVLHKWTHDLQHAADHPPAAAGEAAHGEKKGGTTVDIVTPAGKATGDAAHPPTAKPEGRPVTVNTDEGTKQGYMKDGKVVDAQGNVLAEGLPTPSSIFEEVKREGQSGTDAAEFNRKIDFAEGQMKKVVENPSYFMMIAFGWGHRLAVLLLPIFAGFLALLYVYRRQFFVYDHLIVSMNYLSFIFLGYAIALILPSPVRGWAVLAMTLWSPINLFMTLRGAYGSHPLGAFLKAGILWFATWMLFSLLLISLMLIGFFQV